MAIASTRWLVEKTVTRHPGDWGGAGGDDGDGGDGGGGGGDAGDGGAGGGDGGAGDAQITKLPSPRAKLLLDHSIVSPAAITTLVGLFMSEYRVPPMMIRPVVPKKKVVALTLMIASARKVHRSFLP